MLESLKSNASAKTRKTLDAVFNVCQEQVKNQRFDFSYTTISRLGNGKGVPRPQSIRNSAGEPYRLLIQAFVDAAPSKSKPKSASHPDAWVDAISDPTQRYLTNVLLSELAEARRIIKEIVPPSLEIYVDDRTFQSTGKKADFKLSDAETRALQHLLSDDFLLTHKLEKGAYGDVLTDSGVKLFKPGTLHAIEKALRYL